MAFDSIDKKIRKKILLKDFVYYQIGGPAEFFLEPENELDIETGLKWAKKNSLPCTVIGSGTNLLISDYGIKGLVLFLGPRLNSPITILQEDTSGLLIRVPGWMGKADLVFECAKHGWSGLEFSVGIPGAMGGAVFMNAGTKWGSYSECVEKVRLFNLAQGFFEKKSEQMGFKYRGHGEGILDGQTVVVSVELRLKKTKRKSEITALMDEILSYRGKRQPLEFANCGSVFKNPAQGPGAGRLIEACQLKGFRIGQAMVSEQHANFILNLGGAKAAEVRAVIEHCQKEVLKEKNVSLEREVIFLGDF